MDKYIFSKIQKSNPRLYYMTAIRLYKIYSKIHNFIKYGDPYFINSVNIETTTFCNRKCDYCPNKDYETPKDLMDEKIFKRIISELKRIKYEGVIAYHFFNEPLFDKRIYDFVKYTKNEVPNAIQLLVTNGDYLDLEKAELLQKNGIDKFLITVHDKDPQKNLERLNPVKSILKEKAVIQSSYDLVMNNRGGTVDVSKYEKIENNKRCLQTQVIVFTKDGDAVICCNNFGREPLVGNIMEKSITEIWNGKEYKNIRKSLIKNKPILKVCKDCLRIN